MEFDFLSQFVSQILSNISIPLILSINILTFFVIKIGEEINGRKILDKIYKKFITFVVSVSLVVAFYFYKVSNMEILTVSVLLAPFTYQYIFKSILDKFGIGYKKEDLDIL